jgi:Cu-Zn family superoxide dismutase
MRRTVPTKNQAEGESMRNNNWSRTSRGAAAIALALVTAMTVAPTASAHHGADTQGANTHGGDRGTIEIPGDPAGGSKFEGIGLDERSGTFYVSETTGGEISRGNIHRDAAKPWLDGNGTDGRSTARGITVDHDGLVYIAGGPNGIDHPGAPDLWVYSPGGKLLAKLDTGVDNAFLNDVAIGPDGAAYFTNSNAPQVFRVAKSRSGWQVSTFVDASGTIVTQTGFNLGGIVATGDGRALIVAQGNVGALWRIDLRTKAVTAIAHPMSDLVNADGLVLKGKRLLVIRNFSRVITTLKLSDHWTSAALIDETATAQDRLFTTGKLAGGRLYLVDSKFDTQVAGLHPYEVVVLKI